MAKARNHYDIFPEFMAFQGLANHTIPTPNAMLAKAAMRICVGARDNI
jgi:hypothetical protein